MAEEVWQDTKTVAAMSRAEIRRFLMHGTFTGKLATVRWWNYTDR